MLEILPSDVALVARVFAAQGRSFEDRFVESVSRYPQQPTQEEWRDGWVQIELSAHECSVGRVIYCESTYFLDSPYVSLILVNGRYLCADSVSDDDLSLYETLMKELESSEGAALTRVADSL